MLFVITLCLLSTEDAWVIKDTGIYYPIYTMTSAYHPDHGFYILDRSETRAVHISKSGGTSKSFAIQGQGPFDLISPLNMYLIENTIAIKELTKITLFDLNGNGLDSIKIPQKFWSGYWTRVIDGWVCVDTSPDKNGIMRFYWLSNDLKNVSILKEWLFPYPNPPGDVFDFRSVGFYASPVASKDGKTVYLADMFDFRFYTFDVQSKRETAVIETSIERMPYDVEEGKAQFERMRKKGLRLRKAIYPELHPAIAAFAITPDGHLFVDYRVAVNTNAPVTLTLKGEPTEDPIQKLSWVDRILAIEDGWYWVAGFPDEEFAIARIPASQVVQWFLDNPVEFRPPEKSLKSLRPRTRGR